MVPLVIMTIAMWQALARFVPTIDTDIPLEVIRSATFQQGRFISTAILYVLSPSGSLFNLDILITIFIFAAATAITVIIWRRVIGPEHYAAAAIAAGFPTTVHMFAFAHINMVVAFGMLFGALAVLAWVSGRRLVFGVLLIATAATYQGLLVNIGVIYLVWIAISLLDSGRSWKAAAIDLGWFLLYAVGSIVIYMIAVRLLLSVSGERLLLVGVVLNPRSLLDDPLLIITRTVSFTASIVSGSSTLFIDRGARIGILQVGLIAAALLSVAFVPRLGGRRKSIIAAILLLAVTAPMLVGVFSGGVVRNRSMLAAPIGLAGIAFVAAMAPMRIVRWASFVTVAALVFLYVQIGSQLFMATGRAWDADRLLATRINERLDLARTAPLRRGEKMPFDMIGFHNVIWVSSMPDTTLGASFFHYGHSTDRAVGGMNLMGYDGFRTATAAERLAILEPARKMPVWPLPGSVAIVNGVAVVKFSEWYSPHQIGRACRGARDIGACRAEVARPK